MIALCLLVSEEKCSIRKEVLMRLAPFLVCPLDTITKKVGSTHHQSKCKSVAHGETCGTM